MKTQTTIRVDQNNYTQAKAILRYLGLSYSQAVNIFNSIVGCEERICELNVGIVHIPT